MNVPITSNEFISDAPNRHVMYSSSKLLDPYVHLSLSSAQVRERKRNISPRKGLGAISAAIVMTLYEFGDILLHRLNQKEQCSRFHTS